LAGALAASMIMPLLFPEQGTPGDDIAEWRLAEVVTRRIQPWLGVAVVAIRVAPPAIDTAVTGMKLDPFR
jgi:hypothetical protein